jgi:hypothetical protein
VAGNDGKTSVSVVRWCGGTVKKEKRDSREKAQEAGKESRLAKLHA